jgi:hypothetical protein
MAIDNFQLSAYNTSKEYEANSIPLLSAPYTSNSSKSSEQKQLFSYLLEYTANSNIKL